MIFNTNNVQIVTCTVTQWFIHYLWCVRELQLQELLLIAKKISYDWIFNQIEEYAKKTNPTRDPDVLFDIKTNGTINKYIINSWPETLCCAAEICNKIVEENDTDDKSSVAICCILIRVSSLMRKGFATLLTDKFESENDGFKFEKIEEMIQNIQLATYLTYHLLDELVCLLYLLSSKKMLHLSEIFVTALSVLVDVSFTRDSCCRTICKRTSTSLGDWKIKI